MIMRTIMRNLILIIAGVFLITGCAKTLDKTKLLGDYVCSQDYIGTQVYMFMSLKENCIFVDKRLYKDALKKEILEDRKSSECLEYKIEGNLLKVFYRREEFLKQRMFVSEESTNVKEFKIKMKNNRVYLYGITMNGNYKKIVSNE